MSKIEKMVTMVATADGFHGGRRLRAGDTFSAPANMKGKWFTHYGKDKEGTEDALSAKTDITSLSAAQVKDRVAAMTNHEINEAISAEQATANRKGVLAMLRDELANRVGQVGGPDPAAKNPQETDPLIVAPSSDEDLMN